VPFPLVDPVFGVFDDTLRLSEPDVTSFKVARELSRIFMEVEDQDEPTFNAPLRRTFTQLGFNFSVASASDLSPTTDGSYFLPVGTTGRKLFLATIENKLQTMLPARQNDAYVLLLGPYFMQDKVLHCNSAIFQGYRRSPTSRWTFMADLCWTCVGPFFYLNSSPRTVGLPRAEKARGFTTRSLLAVAGKILL
jgi:hypothetical protein